MNASPPGHGTFIYIALLPLLTSSAAAQAWNGSASEFWSIAANWSPSGIPAAGANLSVQSSTTHDALWLDIDRAIGSFNFGSRTDAFDVQTGPHRTFAISGGLTATGNFTANEVRLSFRGNHRLSHDQTWRVEGQDGGVAADDRGAGFRPAEDGVHAGMVVLDGDLTKTGGGQLQLIGTTLSGPGDLVVDSGTLKLNAGAGLPVSLLGPGYLTLNHSSRLFTARNSGSFGAFTRPIVLTGTSSWTHGGNQVGNHSFPVQTSWNGSQHALTVDRFLSTGGWHGSATVNRSGSASLVIAGSSAGFSGQLNHQSGATRIDGPFQGSIAVTGGSLSVQAAVAGNVTASGTSTVLSLKNQSSPALISGSLTAQAARMSGEVLVGQNIHLDTASIAVDPATSGRLKSSGNLTLTGVSRLSVAGTPVSGQSFAVLEYGGSLILSAGGTYTNYLKLAGDDSHYRLPAFSTNAGNPKQIDLKLNTANLTWTGEVIDNWSFTDDGNWSGGSPQGFRQLDSVSFTDSTTWRNVVIKGTRTDAGGNQMPTPLMPSLVTFSSSSGADYVVTGVSPDDCLSGGARIVKNGTGTVILGGGDNQDYTGTITVNQGVLKMGSRKAFGSSTGIHVTNDLPGQPGGQIDLNGKFFASSGGIPGCYHFHLEGSGPDGEGALVNSIAQTGTLNTDAGVHSITLTGNARISSNGRYDVGFNAAGGTGTLTGNGHKLTVETGFFAASNSASDGRTGMAFMGDASGSPIHIEVAGGVVWAQDSDHAFGGPDSTLTIGGSNARAGTFGPRTIPVSVVIKDEGMLHNQATANSGTAKWTGGFTLEDDAYVHTAAHRIHISGNVGQSAPGATLTKQGSGVLVLSGTCTYTGATTVSAGTLLIDGQHGVAGSSPVNVPTGASSGTTVGGTGEFRGQLSVLKSDGVLAPGDVLSATGGTNPIGTLRTRNLSLTGDYDCQVVGDVSDRIEIQGDLTLNSSPDLDFSFPNGPGTQPLYVVATYTGTLSGSFSSAGLSGSGYSFAANAAAKRFELRKTGSDYPAWANSYNLPGATAEALEDPEGDGFTNYDEFLFGTSPVVATGSPVSVTRAGSTIELRWFQRSSGSTYTPQQSTTLAEGSWTTVTNDDGVSLGNDPITAGTPSGYTRRLLTFDTALSGPRRFVRVIGH